MDLTDKRWQDFDGGYRSPYDASIPLKQLQETNDDEKIKEIFDELWNELHHQGDVGVASYMAVPQLIRIARLKNRFDRQTLCLSIVIEQQRHLGNNPTLPSEFQEYYDHGIKDLEQFVLKNLEHDLDVTTYTIALATLATCRGRIRLGKAIMELEDEEIMNEFLEQF